MLNGVHIWGVCRPWKDVDVLVYKKLPCTCCSMRPSVVMHQHPKVLMTKWNSYRVQYVVYIMLGIQIASDNKVCLPAPHNATKPLHSLFQNGYVQGHKDTQTFQLFCGIPEFTHQQSST